MNAHSLDRYEYHPFRCYKRRPIAVRPVSRITLDTVTEWILGAAGACLVALVFVVSILGGV
jgi:hypothetical protein